MMPQQAWNRLSDQEGMALVLAMFVLLLLAIMTTTLMLFATSNSTSTAHARAWESALLAAEGGIDTALGQLNGSTDPNVSTMLPATTVTIDNATVVYDGVYDPVLRRWTVTSTATIPAPSGGTSSVSRTVRQSLQVRSGPATQVDNPAWGYIYVDGTTGCTTLSSGVRIKQPVYIRNSLCTNNNVRIYASAGTVQVGGSAGITMGGTSWIGLADDGVTQQALPELHVESLGCRHSTRPYSWPCSGSPPPPGQRVLATNQYDALTSITKPPIDLTTRYYDSAPGPMYPCGAGSYGLAANFFETNSTVNDVSAGDRYLLPNSDYACIVPGLGSLVWDYNHSGPGTLTIDGTVFIDGNVFFDTFQQVDVEGTGTIYASGNARFLSGVDVCGKWDVAASTCDWATWSADDGLLFVVAAQGGGGTTLNLDSNVRFQGGLWADKTLDVHSSAIAQGPQIAEYVAYNSQTGSLIIPIGTLPPGAPAVPTWEVVPIPGTWLEL